MRLTRQAALGIALVCGLLAAIGAYLWIGQQSKPVVKAPETVEVSVPIQTIPAQTDLMPEMFKKVSMEKSQVPVNTVVNLQDLVGRVSRQELVMDKPILADQIAIRSSELGLAYTIGTGQRAMSVALDIVASVCDYIQPGNRVDIIGVFAVQGKVVTRTLVQDVLVLGVGTSTTPATAPAASAPPGATPGAAPDHNPPKRPDLPFTLAVTPDQAQIIITADAAGKLRMLLRRMGDHSIVALPAANSWTLIGPIPKDNTPNGPEGSSPGGQSAGAGEASSQQKAMATMQEATARYGGSTTAPPPVPAKPSVEVIRGNQREVVTPQ
jgi:Flp pilus assembly protein CpaB